MVTVMMAITYTFQGAELVDEIDNDIDSTIDEGTEVYDDDWRLARDRHCQERQPGSRFPGYRRLRRYQ